MSARYLTLALSLRAAYRLKSTYVYVRTYKRLPRRLLEIVVYNPSNQQNNG